MPPRAPRKVLWVVVVTTWAWGKGLGWAPPGSVGEVPAGRQRHPQDDLGRRRQGEQHGLVGLGAGMGLDVGKGATEEALGALDGQPLDHVDVLAAAVVTPSGIALGILVGHHAALGEQHRGTDDVLRGDELDLLPLALDLAANGGVDLGVGAGQCGP